MSAVLLTEWEWHPGLVALLTLAALGYAVMWRRSRVSSRLALVAWEGGLLAIAVATCSRLDPLSDVRLSAHMVQHELLTFVAAPLLTVGSQPLTIMLLPRLRAPIARWGHAITRPRIAWTVATVVLWAWHWPVAYDFALAHPTMHDLEHAALLTAYALYWSPFTSFGYAVPVLRTSAARVFYLTTGGAQSSLLGALLAFNRAPLYTHYLAAGGEFALRDQQLGGGIMLLSGAAVFAIAAVVTVRDE